MKKLLLHFATLFLLSIANCQLPYWQQQVNYTIDVSLNDTDHKLDGFEKIEYTNNSPDTLKFIWFHLWPNAFKNDKTAYGDQALESGSLKFYFAEIEQRGYINRLDFKVNNITTTLEDHPQHIDIVKLILPSALAPGAKCIITTPFHIKLPDNFSRGGHAGQAYQVTQWYPKPAVYDRRGWHPIPYLNQGEFYSEFGNYDVRITLPANYAVAATGELQNDNEKEWLKARAGFIWNPLTEKLRTKGGVIKNVIQQFPPSAKELKTIQFIQDNVHDFAWFADKRFIVNADTCLITSGKIIEVFTFYTEKQKETWSKSMQFTKDALRTRSKWIGPYPYKTMSVVEGPQGFGGGMEYSSITVISPIENPAILDFTIAHETGHNWFYGALGSNERMHPWMDEGLNTFYDNRYSKWKYPNGEIKLGVESVSLKQLERILFETNVAVKKDQPISLPGHEFTTLNYNLSAYYKTGAWLEWLEKQIGKDALDKAMQEYYKQWQSKHPYPEDFKKVLEESTGRDLDSFFSMLGKNGNIPRLERTGWKTAGFPWVKKIMNYVRDPSQHLLMYGPAIGINSYDKLMIGGMFTNYKLPASNFQFFLSPMYATGSKRFTGLGRLQYNFYPKGVFGKVDLFLNGSTFTANKFADTSGREFFLAFQKLVPGIRITWKEKKMRNTFNRYVQWKTYFIRENALRFSRDTIINGIDTSIIGNYQKQQLNSTLNQLIFFIGNSRLLYPYSGELKLEQSKDFIRTTFTGKYFFNYSKGGGLDLRLFAGKFFYTGSKTVAKQFLYDRYHLNMTGADGYEDYTYSDYFIGRNKFNGLANQQIMLRDGGFKVRTNLLADKVGKTDNWLAAINLTSTIPDAINIFNIMPLKLPVKIFADVGTYAEAWEKNSGLDRFIFDAGFYLSLLKETVNIYLPVIYSPVFGDYFKSTLPQKNRWLKTISFTIDISNFSLKKMNDKFSFLNE